MPAALTVIPTESVTVRHSSPDLLDLDAVYQPSSHPPPKHWHPDQDEHFEVVEGTVRVVVDGVARTLSAGDTIDIPRGAVHQFWNPGTEAARVRWQIRPAGRSEEWFRSIDAVHRAGKVGKDGMPGLLAFAVFLTEYRDVFRLAVPGAPVVRVVLAGLARVGRARGYRAVAPARLGAE